MDSSERVQTSSEMREHAISDVQPIIRWLLNMRTGIISGQEFSELVARWTKDQLPD